MKMPIKTGKKTILKRLANYDLFEAPIAAGRMPSMPELYELFELFNRKYFGGRLPSVRISISRRMLVAGLYLPIRQEIRLGVKYHELFPGEIEDTLKHEMIHILCPYHDRKFKELANRIGASLKAHSHPDLRLPSRYLYLCPACGREYPRRKRLRMASCGVCSRGGKFDLRFKLKLAKDKPKKQTPGTNGRKNDCSKDLTGL